MDEAEEVDLQTTTGLHAEDYWYGGQTTIRFVHQTTIGLSANDYFTEPFPQQLHAPAYEAITLSAALKRGSSSEIPY